MLPAMKHKSSQLGGMLVVCTSFFPFKELTVVWCNQETCTYREGPDGLQYCDITVGKGPEPFEGDVVKCNYVAKLAETGTTSLRSPHNIRVIL
eukprot:2182677-Pyramimonas_sp.AAC.1